MKSLVSLAGVLFFASLSFGETSTFTVEGMHCGACKSMVQKSVCDDPAIKSAAAKCSVSFNEKTKLGVVTLVSKTDQKIDVPAVETAITTTDSAYKITKKETK